MIFKKSIPIFICLALILSLLSCNKTEKNINNLINNKNKLVYNIIDGGYNNNIKASINSIVEENNLYKLSINGKTTEINLLDKTSGNTWYSNPIDKNSDQLATGGKMEVLSSQVTISYEDDKMTTNYLNSFANSITKDQYSFCKIDNGIRVNYIIGEKPKTQIFPRVLSVERYNKFIGKMEVLDKGEIESYYQLMSLSNYANPADKEMMLIKYPLLKKRDLYVLTLGYSGISDDVPEYLQKTIEGAFKNVGYNQNELDKDNIENSVKIKKVVDMSVSLSLEYILTETGLNVKIPVDSIVCDESVVHLKNIEVLPFFGAGSVKDEGYLFLPDGSGAIINFNSNKKNYNTYKKKVYSQDKSNPLPKTDILDEDNIFLPVFGMKVNDDGFIAVIDGADTTSYLNAAVRGQVNGYNYAYPSFQLKNDMIQLSSTINLAGNKIFQKGFGSSDISIKYIFLQKGKATYSNMAATYRNDLTTNKMLSSEKSSKDYPLFLNFIGSVDYIDKSFFIPIKRNMKLTGYNELKGILKELRGKGLNDKIILEYLGWQNHGVNNTISNDVKLISSLGSKNDYFQLLDFCKNQNVDLFSQVDFQYVRASKKFDGFNEDKNAARDLSGKICNMSNKNIVTNSFEILNNSYIVSPNIYLNTVQKYLKKYIEFGNKNLSLASIGTDINSDFSDKNYQDANMAKNKIIGSLNEVKKENFNILLNGANAYSLFNVSAINYLPMTSSDNYLFDESVPFFQMIIRGIIPYAANPINMSNDYKFNRLKLIETGSSPLFKWMKAENSIIKETEFDYYSANYSLWIDDSVKLYNELKAIYDGQGDIGISNHEKVSYGVYLTEYENGLKVYVNYSDIEYKHDDIQILPFGFYVKR